jgi:toxin ParE1/3/4
VVDRLLDAIETTIPAFPHIGRAGRILATREWIVSGLPYIIVYTIDETRDVITIIGVFHGAQNR